MDDEARSYESFTPEEQQDISQRAIADYMTFLRALTPAQTEAYFAKLDRLYNRAGYAPTRCPQCGHIVMELKWSRDHIEWQCLEETCGNRWEWKKR